MNTQIQSLHFDADKKLIAFVEEKVSKLSTYYDGIIGKEVILKLDKSSSNENKIAEIKIKTRNGELFAKKQKASFEEAVDLATDALKTQIQKEKSKLMAK
jgi:putative sigma-54 modulation protein